MVHWRLSQEIKGYQPYQQTGPIRGFLIDLPENAKVKLRYFVYGKEKDIGFLYFVPEEYHRIGSIFFKKFLKNQTQLKRSLRLIFDYSKQLRVVVKDYHKINFKKFSDRKLFKLYQKFTNIHEKLWSIAMVPNLLEFENSYLTDYLIEYLQERLRVNGKKRVNLVKFFSILITEKRLSNMQKQEIDLLKIIKWIQKHHKISMFKGLSTEDIIRKLQKEKRIRQLIKTHRCNYAYLGYNWAGPPTSLEEYVQEIKNFITEGNSAGAKLLQIKETIRNNILKQKSLQKELKIDSHHLKLFAILRDIIFSKADRMEAAYFSYFQMESLFKEIAKRLYLSLSQVWSIPTTEMHRFLVKRSFTLKEVNEMGKLCLLYVKAGQLKYCTGQQAKKKLDKIRKTTIKKIKDVKELMGTAAYPGRISGVVKIIFTKQDFIKMSKGDILVSSYTDPTLMPAIKKAGAIITDVGGMTCHAAIISRELGIPCIIGTKIATKVLRDGQMVEVDAESGVVRIIEQ